MKLSEQQTKVVEYEGYLVVTAPPGSGKTSTLVSKIEKNQKKSNKKTIALTFSNKAAEELKSRIVDKNNVTVGTIHSFCQELVMSRGYLIGLPEDLNIINEEVDKLFVLKNIINNNVYISNRIKNQSDDYLKKILNFIKKQKENFINPEYFLEKKDSNSMLLYEIYNNYNNMMINQKIIDFDDLIYYAYLILIQEETQNLYKRLYGHLYIDEAQDLNLSQYQIIKVLSTLIDDVMLIGDPSQAIYKFMGSDKKIMETIFKNDFNAKVIKLNENFRSTKKIVELINVLKGENESLSKYPLDGIVEYSQYADEDEEALAIVDKIKNISINNNLKHEDIAIIGRNIYVFNSIIKVLESEKIPYNIGAEANINMESNIGLILLEYVKLVSNPYNGRVRSGFMSMFTLEDDNIETINTFIKENYSYIFDIVDRSTKVSSIFPKMIHEYIEIITNDRELSDEEKYLTINDLGIIYQHWNNYLLRSSVNTKTIKSFINEFNMGKTMKFSLEGISLLTIHKSKGLEFNTTFVVGLNEGTLPDYRAKDIESMQEEDNNVYVAFSRAKRECYISSVKKKMMPWGNYKNQQESRYIEKVKLVI